MNSQTTHSFANLQNRPHLLMKWNQSVGVYRQACSGIPLAVRFVGRDRLLWNSMVQGTQRFRYVWAASCVIPYVLCGGLYCLRCWSPLRGSLPALIYPGGQGYMESPSRVLLESNYNLAGQFPCTTASSTPIRVVTKEVRYIHALSLTLEYSMAMSSPLPRVWQAPELFVAESYRRRVLGQRLRVLQVVKTPFWLLLDLPSDAPSSGHSTGLWHYVYNLPPWLCMKRKFIMMPVLIPSPKQPGNDIDVNLKPLINDLLLLWKEEGVRMWDAHTRNILTYVHCFL